MSGGGGALCPGPPARQSPRHGQQPGGQGVLARLRRLLAIPEAARGVLTRGWGQDRGDPV